MYALIVKEEYGYELQIKNDINSNSKAHAGRCTCDEILKQSITAEWDRYEGEEKDIVWIAKIV